MKKVIFKEREHILYGYYTGVKDGKNMYVEVIPNQVIRGWHKFQEHRLHFYQNFDPDSGFWAVDEKDLVFIDNLDPLKRELFDTLLETKNFIYEFTS